MRCVALGDAGVVVELGDRLDVAVSRRAAALADAVRADPPPGVLGAVATMASVLVRYDPLVVSYAEAVAVVTDVVERSPVAGDEARDARRDDGVASGRRVVLPACYGGALGPDLDGLAAGAGIAPDELVALHAEVDYHVHMVGFLPGFAYLGPVAPALRRGRRATPRVRVPARSVAVAGELTAVYPVDSPGGWHVLGAVPVDMFSPHADPPGLLAPGDTVRFTPVDRARHDDLRAAWLAGEWAPEIQPADVAGWV